MEFFYFLIFIFRFFKNIYRKFFFADLAPVKCSTGGKGIPPDEPAIGGTVAMLLPIHPANFFFDLGRSLS